MPAKATARIIPQFLLALLVTALSSARARELQVAKTGRDTGDGSAGAPFATIGRAAHEAQPGDIVTIHAGTYREAVVLTRGGTAENARIVFTAAPGETVVIKGSELVADWKPEGGGVWRAEVPDTLFGGFNPYTTEMSGQPGHHLGAVYLDGGALAEQPTREALNKSAGGWFAQKSGSATSIWANFGAIDPTKKPVEINVRPAAFAPAGPDVNFVTVDHLAISQIANGAASLDAAQPGAISTGGGRHWIIQNCAVADVSGAGIALEQPSRDLTRAGPGFPAFGEFEDIAAAGHHIVRNNLIQRCGQAGIFGSVHGTDSEISYNQIEDIGRTPGDDTAGIRLAVAVDTVIRGNLIRRVKSYGIVLGPLYQGVRITRNVIAETQASPLYFLHSHGPALVDHNIVAGPGAASGEGVKLRGAEANVFAHNFFADCACTSEPLPPQVAGGTISYRPHTLVTKQTIPSLPLDNRWLANVFLRGGLDKLPHDHDTEVDFNAYLGGAAKAPWADAHSASAAGDGGFALTSTSGAMDLTFDLPALPRVKEIPQIGTDSIGLFALTQHLEEPDGRPIVLDTDFFGNAVARDAAMAGPFCRYPAEGTTGARLFERHTRTEVAP